MRPMLLAPLLVLLVGMAGMAADEHPSSLDASHTTATTTALELTAGHWLLGFAVLWFALPATLALLSRRRGRTPRDQHEGWLRRDVWASRCLLVASFVFACPAAVAPWCMTTLRALALPAGTFALSGWIGWRLKARSLAHSPHATRLPFRVALVVAALVVAAAWLSSSSETGPWDIVCLALLAAAGIWTSTGADRQAQARVRLRAVGYAFVFGALLFEASVRTLLPAPQPLPPPQNARALANSRWDDRCVGLFPDAYPAGTPQSFAARTANAGERSYLVLHVGDSMTEGAGVVPERTFAAELERLQPDVTHVNAGYGATGTDFQMLLIEDWTQRLAARGTPPDLVVLHQYGNDIGDLLSRYRCCANRPLLEWSGFSWKRRCPRPLWDNRLVEMLKLAPAPYVLRTCAWFSAGAAHLVLRGWPLRSETSREDGSVWARRAGVLLGEIARRLAERDIDFVVTTIGVDPATPAHGRVPDPRRSEPLSELAATHTEVWLLSEALSAGRSPAQRAALLARDGFHYSEAGHSAAAAWLDPLIRARLKSRAERRGSAR